MSLQIEGKIIEIGAVQVVSDRFKKREFVLELTDEVNGNSYTNYAKFQIVQTKCEILDKYKVGDNVNVSFNIKGNKWEKDGKTNYITNLDAWSVTSAAQQLPVNEPYNAANTATAASGITPDNNSTEFDNLPF